MGAHRQTKCTTLALILLICIPISSAAQNRAAEEQRLEALVAQHLGIFVTVPKQRDPAEHVALEGGTLTIGFLKGLPGELNSTICEGGRWLLTGRLNRTEGARALFQADSQVRRIRLEFLNLKTTVHPSARGRYEQNRSVIRRLFLEIGRKKAMSLDPEVLKRTLQGPRCAKLVKTLMDEVWIAERAP